MHMPQVVALRLITVYELARVFLFLVIPRATKRPLRKRRQAERLLSAELFRQLPGRRGRPARPRRRRRRDAHLGLRLPSHRVDLSEVARDHLGDPAGCPRRRERPDLARQHGAPLRLRRRGARFGALMLPNPYGLAGPTRTTTPQHRSEPTFHTLRRNPWPR